MASDITNYVSYLDPTDFRSRIGHLDLQHETIQPLYFQYGAPVTDLYQVIDAGEDKIFIDKDDEALPASSVKLLPPISGRDILAVGKNYFDHAKEFNRSGFDSSDKVDVPSHPVIFTKRATSIIPAGADIYHHPEFTQSLDYEGEIGVIVGKAGFKVKEEEAMAHVWGYTIINDVTARERQRDHKQFFIGKSGDTFCPMGPIAKPASRLPEVLRVQTVVNGKPEQDATTDDLIFSIPFLIETLSEGITLQPGDVIATGTPAGVGIGKTPPVYLKPGDTISISVTGLGTLTNTVTSNPPTSSTLNPSTTPSLHSTLLGMPNKPPVLFLPHPGASPTSLRPLISALNLSATRAVHLLSHPPTPLSPLAPADLPSLIAAHARAHALRNATLIAHGITALAATRLAAALPHHLSGIILLAPVAAPLPEHRRTALRCRGRAVARRGIGAVLDDVVVEEAGGEAAPLFAAAVRLALEGGSADAYARWCLDAAEAEAEAEGREKGGVEVRAVVGKGDGLAPAVGVAEKVFDEVEVLEEVGRWMVLEDVEAVAGVVRGWL